ncbi:Peptidoglycan-binding Lysin subgroup [Penicillium italicum]|uniref:Peptidoglycan-binding Lysin subgroup n=1 Tax=Penicillium italicum TaxID=40296 RepID=A0A0A2KFY3_PENIT|nr:Peptidoglycan-binding Lysin subgroup [Penicillium italicum]
MTTIVNSPWGQQLLSPAAVSSRISRCLATASYSVTYTASSTPTSTSTAIATAGDNVRCNVTDPSSNTYVVPSANTTCVDISTIANVSTPALESMNALGSDCSYLTKGQTLCLPDVCDIYKVSSNDTCTSILGKLRQQISTPTFRSWNPSINSACSNLQALKGEYICLSPPGTTVIPNSFALKAVTTAAPVPDNAVTTSNTDCGFWYTIQDGDMCDTVASIFSISEKDFYFLNPQLNNTCDSLWLNNSYCVQAVGSIQTYSGYASTTSNSLSALTSTINVNATVTANRTTTWLLPTGLSISTTTGTYNDTAYEMTKGYTLCLNAISYYSLDLDDLAFSDLMTNTAWYSKWDRVCDLDLSQPTPTIPFNTSIPLGTASQTSTASSQAAAGSTSTIVSASSTKSSTSNTTTSTTSTSTTSTSAATSTATGLVISPDAFTATVVPPAIIVLSPAVMTPRESAQAVFPLMVSAERATTTGPVSIRAMETAATLMVTVDQPMITVEPTAIPATAPAPEPLRPTVSAALIIVIILASAPSLGLVAASMDTVDPPTSTVYRLSVIVLMADVTEGKQTLELTHWSSLKSSNFQGSKAGGTGGGPLEHKITRIL